MVTPGIELDGVQSRRHAVTSAPQPPYNPVSAHRVTKLRPPELHRRSQRTKTVSRLNPAHVQQTSKPQHVIIGTILSNGEVSQEQYKCYAFTCLNKTFGRLAELRRHHACEHGVDGKMPQFWCPIEGCERSRTRSGKAFPRKDKMFDHLSKVHANIVGS